MDDISIDLRSPWVSKIKINDKLQMVEYESLLDCGSYGHVQDFCLVEKELKMLLVDVMALKL
ncbi:hypothetical protein Gohar_003924 [Gossypium harknessii]|uniref:Uncharacterized protein n=1 Tax=Gossypium harknessii TaxID=34285 RepID=A0A7J9H3B9_9ROSI|nr:hypothetical protein [Gossypium harknessii]